MTTEPPWATITFDPPPGTRCATCLDLGTYHDRETGDLTACACEVGDRKAAEIPWLRRRDAEEDTRMDLYQVSRRNAAAVAPSLTVPQLTSRLNQAEAIMEASTAGSDRHTVASAAWDAFEAELTTRHPSATEDQDLDDEKAQERRWRVE